MGEKIKTLAKGEFFNNRFEVELNHPLKKGCDQQIHIQSSQFRFEIDRKDYIKYSLAILVAEKNLKNLKNLW